MIRFLFISLFVAMACLANGQTVIVNPDGTHTVVLGSDQPGLPTIIVHPNGQHSVVYTTGATSIVVGPDGRHTVMLGLDQPGLPKTIVHPDGKNSQLYLLGTHAIVVGASGSQTVYTQGLLPVSLHVQLAMILALTTFIH